MKVQTVKVKADTKSGYVTINASDFNESNHTLYATQESDKPEEAKTQTQRKTRTKKVI